MIINAIGVGYCKECRSWSVALHELVGLSDYLGNPLKYYECLGCKQRYGRVL